VVSDRITNTERQLNLTYAIMLTGDRGMTMKEIAKKVPGYGYSDVVTPKLQKLITRDMNDIRTSGIEIRQSRLQSSSDNHNFAYAIGDNSFTWPKGFSLSSNQTRLLELAANCWREATLNEELNFAMTRMAALGEAPNREEMHELLPSFRPMDASFRTWLKRLSSASAFALSTAKPAPSGPKCARFPPGSS